MDTTGYHDHLKTLVSGKYVGDMNRLVKNLACEWGQHKNQLCCTLVHQNVPSACATSSILWKFISLLQGYIRKFIRMNRG
jgi:hypothetical protein